MALGARGSHGLNLDRGSGLPLVLIPGLQGRWEYSASNRSRTGPVLSGSDVFAARRARRPRPGSPKGFDYYTHQILTVLDRCRIESAVICGVSFGGRIALRFAAQMPARTSALVLASAPGPHWHLSQRHAKYVRRPLLYAPVFFAASPDASGVRSQPRYRTNASAGGSCGNSCGRW